MTESSLPVQQTWFNGGTGVVTMTFSSTPTTPISADEMELLSAQLSHLKTTLLWSYCEWARELRHDPASLPQVQERLQRTFANAAARLLELLLPN